jgi:hypothetical protein
MSLSITVRPSISTSPCHHQGHPVRKIKTKSEDRKPYYITICNSGNICYSDSTSLYCIKPDGEEVFTYSSPDLSDAWGVTTDSLY